MKRTSTLLVVGLLSCLAPLHCASDARANPAPGGRRVAVLFAVADYRNFSDLRLTVKDAQDLSAVLQQLGFEVRLVTDATDPKASTAALIDQTLQQYAFATGPDDVFLFYFSGHGFSLAGQAGARDYICPSEMTGDLSTGFPIERARSILLDQRCQAGQRIVIVDACRSLKGVEIPGAPIPSADSSSSSCSRRRTSRYWPARTRAASPSSSQARFATRTAFRSTTACSRTS